MLTFWTTDSNQRCSRIITLKAVNKGDFAAYLLEKGKMPPFGYLLNHPEAGSSRRF